MTNYPAHWKTKRLEDVSDVIDPHPSHRAPAIDPNGIPFVGIGDVREDGVADFRRARLVSPKILSEHAERYSLESDLIGLGRVASVGKVVKLPKGGIPYTISPTLAVISSVDISFEFLYYALQSPQIQNQLTGLKQGSGRQSVGILKLRKVLLPFPPVEEQLKIVELLQYHLSRLDAALTDLKQAKIRAAQFRRSLLQSTFAGKFDTNANRSLSVTFDEAFEVGKTARKAVKQRDYLREGKFPVIDQGEDFISGYSNEESLVLDFKKPVIIFGDHTRRIKYVDFPFIAGADGTKILVQNVVLDSQFACYQLQSKELRNKGYARHFSELRKEKFWIPPINEQLKIVEQLDEHFSRLNVTISLADAMEKQSIGLRRSLLQAAFTGQLTKEVVGV
jgi:type I restriction enzyme S subunit